MYNIVIYQSYRNF